jgi:hypothetical protein
MDTQLNLYQKKHKLILGGFGVAVLLVAVIVMLINGPDPESIIRPLRNPVIFYVLMFAGLTLTLYLLRFVFNSLRNPKPRVILSASGATVDGFSGRFSAPWEELAGYSVNNSSMFVLHLKDIQAYLAKTPQGRPRETAKALTENFGSPLLIETNMLDTDANTIKSFLEKHIREIKS